MRRKSPMTPDKFREKEEKQITKSPISNKKLIGQVVPPASFGRRRAERGGNKPF